MNRQYNLNQCVLKTLKHINETHKKWDSGDGRAETNTASFATSFERPLRKRP